MPDTEKRAMQIPVPAYIRAISPYVPGKPPEELERELGISDAAKLASNENSLGASPKAVAAVTESLSSLHRYPDGGGYRLTHRLAAHLHVEPGNIILGNGSDEIIAMLARIFLRPGDEVIIPSPSFLMYEITARSAGADVVHVPLKAYGIDPDAVARAITPSTRIVFICNPNNPTGGFVSHDAFAAFLKHVPPTVLVVVDEAYVEFVRHPIPLKSLGFIDADPPVVVLRTFSKAYGLAGLRIGYGVMGLELARHFHRIRPPFNASVPAQAGALGALEDQDFLDTTVRMVHTELDRLYGELDALNIGYVPTQANFFLVDVGRDADAVFSEMLTRGVIVRSMTAYGYPTHIRVSIGRPEENQRFVAVLSDLLK